MEGRGGKLCSNYSPELLYVGLTVVTLEAANIGVSHLHAIEIVAHTESSTGTLLPSHLGAQEGVLATQVFIDAPAPRDAGEIQSGS